MRTILYLYIFLSEQTSERVSFISELINTMSVKLEARLLIGIVLIVKTEILSLSFFLSFSLSLSLSLFSESG